MKNLEHLKEVKELKNIHWDVVFFSPSVAFGAAGVDSVSNAAAKCFPRSKMLGKPSSPVDNEGIVHLIHRIELVFYLENSGAGEAGANFDFQIRRRDPGAGVVAWLRGGTPIDEVAYEKRANVGSAHHSTGTAGSQVFYNSPMNLETDLKHPLVMVRPYYGKLSGFFSSASAQTCSLIVECSMLVESVRVEGKKYRQLLGEYTQMTSSRNAVLAGLP